MNDIAIKIQKIMKEKNISYGELSKVTDIPKSALFRYVTGETEKIPLSRIKTIAQALGVSSAFLMGWDENEKPSDTETDLDSFRYALYNETKDVSDATKQSILAFIKYAKSLEKEEENKKE